MGNRAVQRPTAQVRMENAGLTALSEHDRRHGVEILRDDVTIGGGKGVSWELEMEAWRNSSGEVSA